MQNELLTGAEILMRSLEAEGVDVLFGYPGGAIMPVYDALYDHRDRLHHVLVRQHSYRLQRRIAATNRGRPMPPKAMPA